MTMESDGMTIPKCANEECASINVEKIDTIYMTSLFMDNLLLKMDRFTV